jgi:pyruvate/2-oxoglutarate dehydrogenase complex dihydrolipoamide acyltransferase (E2) component
MQREAEALEGRAREAEARITASGTVGREAFPDTPLIEVIMPVLDASITEGTVTRWLKHQGDYVYADEPLLEISTDKVDTEIFSPGSGILEQINVHEDETVANSTVLAVIRRAEPPSPASRR